jgi:methionyl-tRNA synthetase
MKKEEISFPEFIEISNKLEIKLGTITNVHRMENSNKMLKLTVDFGDNDIRAVMTNIGNNEGLNEEGEAEEKLTNKQFPFVTNLAPATMMGVKSEAMIVLPSKNDKLNLFNPENGSTLI